MRARLLFLLPFAGLIAACPKAPPAPTAQERAEAEALRTDVGQLSLQAEQLLREQDELVWRFWTEGVAPDIAATYRKEQAPPFGLEALRKIERLRALSRDPQEVRALTHLHNHFAGEYLSRELAEVSDAVANLEASLSVTANGREVRYRDLPRALANERDAAQRRALYQAATPALQRLNQSLTRKEQRTEELIRALGYPSYEAFGAELRQADLGKLAQLAEEILQTTEAPFREVMGRLARAELGVPFEQLTRADVPRLFRPQGVDALFPAEAALERARATLAGVGVSLDEVPGLRIDAADRPRKNPRPLAIAVRVPEDVRLSVKPAAGVDEHGRVMHELGHALHAAYTRPSRWELTKLGNPTVAEAWGGLLEDLLEDPVWLEEQARLAGPERAQYLAAHSAYTLYRVRRAAGLLLYQLEARRRGGADARALYHAVMERTYQMPMTDDDDARYLVDLEDFFESADHFRALFLAGQLQGQLKARFGPAWWRNRAAGDWLRTLWGYGNALSARELAEAAGEKQGIQPDVLLLRLGTTLGVPMKLGQAPGGTADGTGSRAAPTPAAP